MVKNNGGKTVSGTILTFEFFIIILFNTVMMDILLEVLINANNPDILYTIHSLLPLDYYIPLIDHTFSKKWIFIDHTFSQKCIFIGKATYRNGLYHSFDDKPAIIYSDGSKEWCKHGKLHRDDDRPAVICHDGTQFWYKHGKRHRDNNQSALICSDGSQEYYKNGKRYYPNI